MLGKIRVRPIKKGAIKLKVQYKAPKVKETLPAAKCGANSKRSLTNEDLYFFRSSGGAKGQYMGENWLSVQLTNLLKQKTLEGKCKACWTKIAHEGKHSANFSKLMRNMGKLAGVPDFIFTWSGGHLWLELKNGKKGILSSEQEYFIKWCGLTNSNVEVATTIDEAEAVLKKYGII